MQEVWKDIAGYEGLYQASSMGRIRRLRFINNYVDKRKITIVKAYPINSGYLKIMFHKDGGYENKLVHRIIAETFIPNPKGLDQVNHKDGNKHNNNADNLEWCTQSENMRHAVNMGLFTAFSLGKYGADNPKAIPVEMLDKNTGELLKRFGSLIDAAHFLGKEKSGHIVSCCKGKLKSAYGYRWRYGR